MDTVLTVSQITTYIRSLLDGDPNLDPVYLCGEISNFNAYQKSGHWYFSLKDANAVLRCVMFRSANQRLRFCPENGMRVLIRGRISVYERDGTYQLYAEDMLPDGAGALAVAFEQLRRRLEAEGLFDPARKRPLPDCPMTVGVITSPSGAARRDIEHILARRFPLAEILLAPVPVQGADAPAQLADALDRMNADGGAEVIIIGRGGGSAEELWAFNDERVVRAVARSRIPVISAVGHETDVTLCDFAADYRAPTPSAAAEVAVPDQAELTDRLAQLQVRMTAAAARTVRRADEQLRAVRLRPVWQSPPGVESAAQRYAHLHQRLVQAGQRRLNDRTDELRWVCAQLDALSPLRVLARGYAAVQTDRPVTRAAQLTAGVSATLRFADGCADCTIHRVTVNGNAERNEENGEERKL